MESFSFSLPEANLLFGRKTVSELGKRAKQHGDSALLVTGRSSMRKHGFLQKAKTSLESAGIDVTLFEGVEPNPTVGTVQKGVKAGLDNGCDLVVAIGGGTAIDAA